MAVEPEADMIREGARRVLAGEALGGVVADLQRRKVKTVAGKDWQRITLRSVLISARIAGWREHSPGYTSADRMAGGRREAQWTGGEFVAKGDWPAILTRRETERLRKLLTDPSRRTGPSTRSYLLSGILRCTDCDLPLHGANKKDKGRPEYLCRSGGNGCGRGIVAEPVEQYVFDRVYAALRSGELTERLRHANGEDSSAAWQAAADLESDLAALSGDWGAGRITRTEWQAAREPLTARLKSAQSALQRQTGREAADLLSGGAKRFLARWEAGSVSERRAMLSAALSAVTVAAGRGGRNGDPTSRLSLVWRG